MNLFYRNQRNAELTAKFWNKDLSKPDWYEIKNQGDDQQEIIIYDVIGWPYNDVQYLVRAIAEMKGKQILTRINSPGGDVFDGMALFNAFRSHNAKVTMRVEGFAASIASVIAMAGKEVQAYKNTMMMIHKSWIVAVGNEFELQDITDVLHKVDQNIQDVYTDKTKLGKKEVADMMKNETYLNAKEMKDKGFIDAIVDGKSVKAEFDLSIFQNAPESFLNSGGTLTEREIETALRDAGASRTFAKSVAAGGRNTYDQRDAESDLKSLILKIKEGLKND